MLTYLAAWNLNRGFEPSRYPGSAHQTLVPVQTFRTADGFITIFCGKERFWRELCVALDASGLAEDPRFKTFDQRFVHREEVVNAIQERFLTGTTAHWITQSNGKVPCGPVSSLTEALKAPGLTESGTIVEVDHPQFGRLREVNTPIRFEGRREQHRRAPELGEDTQAVLREDLAYSEERIAELRQGHVI